MKWLCKSWIKVKQEGECGGDDGRETACIQPHEIFEMPLPVGCGLHLLSMSTANQSQHALRKHWREHAFTKLFPDQTSVEVRVK